MFENSNQVSAIDPRKAGVTRARILDAAAKVFVDKGYVATRLSDIAVAACLQAGSIYYHFDSKEQIFEEVVDLGMKLVVENVKTAIINLGPEATFRDRIGIALDTHLSELLERSNYLSANIRNFGQISEELQTRNMRRREDYGALWSELLESAKTAGVIREDANLSLIRMLLLGALNWSLELYDNKKEPSHEIAKELNRMLFDGISTVKIEKKN